MNEIEMIAKSVDLAHKYYQPKYFKHAVAIYKALDGKGAYTQAVGLCHDLLDGSHELSLITFDGRRCTEEEIESAVGTEGLAAIKLLTSVYEREYISPYSINYSSKIVEQDMKADEQYFSNLKNILNSGNQAAIDVARADVFDHVTNPLIYNKGTHSRYTKAAQILKIDELL